MDLSITTTVLGTCAAVSSTVAFVPQIAKMWKTGGNDVSYLMLSLYVAGVTLWLAYGITIGATALSVANGASILFAGACLVLKRNRTGRRRVPADRAGTVISIRRAVAGDAQKIGRVFDAAVAEGWKYLGELARHPMFLPEEWDKLVAELAPPNALLVALNEMDEIIGYTAVHQKDGELYLLFVHPEHAGRGVGRALLAAAHEVMRVAGCREAFLYTHEQNKRALAVYEAAGYRRDGTVRESDFRGVHLREPRLVKAL